MIHHFDMCKVRKREGCDCHEACFRFWFAICLLIPFVSLFVVQRITDIEPRCSLDSLDPGSKEDIQLLLDVITHTADLSNQCLSRESSFKWGELVTTEFQVQNKHEKKFNLVETEFMKVRCSRRR
jgi:hypothetical protein